MIFIERVIYRELKAGVDRMVADPALFEKFILSGLIYEGMDLSALQEAEDEASRARQAFVADPPTVLHGYARVDGVFPCYAITLGGESTDQDYIGEDAMDSYLADPIDDDSRELYRDSDGNRLDPHIRRWGHNFDVFTYVDHPDSCLYYYYLAKQILAEARSAFIFADLDDINYNGADLAPDTRYLPSGMFVRRLGIKLMSDQEYFETTRPGVGQATSIAGAHVAEDDNDATGVTARTTTYRE
ncbi:MAG: hypothetical protein KJN79_01185 [Gammaproteobacteria bacterium]|nr:hypothetical protein [Gammaproteobacteria bacterium]